MHRFHSWLTTAIGALLLVVGQSASGQAPGKVAIVIGDDAPRLERFAAQELAGQFKLLFGGEVAIVAASDTASAAADGSTVLVGSPLTNAAIKKLAGDSWPKLSDQGFVIKTVDRDGQPVLVVGGDTPAATLWAVYELGQRFGVRYLLAGDVYPAEAPALRLSGFHVVAEPELRMRAWQAIDDLPTGSSAWGLAEHRRVLRQLAKLKFNRVILNVYPWQPFVDFEFEGLRKSTAELWYGWKFPIDGDTAGRAAFKGAHEFTNPDLAGKSSPAETIAAGVTLLNGIIASAHELGMTVGLCVSPLEFPPEFAPLLPGAEPCGIEKLTIGPGPKQTPSDAGLPWLGGEQLQAYLRSYPQVDANYLAMPRVANWAGHGESGWARIQRQIPAAARADLSELLTRVKSRKGTVTGQAAADLVETQVAALEAYNRLPTSDERVQLPDGAPREMHLAGIDPALATIVAQIGAVKVGMLLDADAQSAAAERPFDEFPAKSAPDAATDTATDTASATSRNCLMIGLVNDSAGPLPQSTVSSLPRSIRGLAERGWAGYATRSQMPGDLDYALQYLAQASWQGGAEPAAVLDELITAMCGSGVTDRVALAFAQIEQATILIAEQDADFAALAPDMVMKHYTAAEAPPDRWQKLQDLYVGAMNEMYRAHDRSQPRGRPFLRYYCKRLEFAVEYVASVQALRRAGAARAGADQETQIAELEKATESMYNALSALAEVARDSGDRGAIAVLNAWGYRPLQQALADADAQ
jgi:hypothetical protein